MLPWSMSTIPTPTTGWGSTPVIVMHHDGTGSKPACLEEVLGQSMTGEHMSVELRDPTLAQQLPHPIPPGPPHRHFPCVLLHIDQPDHPDLLGAGLGQHVLHPGEDEPEGNAVDP